MTALPQDAVALVGMAGRFPGARDPDSFWANVIRGASSVTRRTDLAHSLLWARGELHEIDSFDPMFFGMSPRDALLLDPQHRILLECAWEALADAAVEGRDPIRRTAVFAGANYSGYRELLGRDESNVSAVAFDSGTDKDFLATTIAYRLGLEGPCLTVQTACSSSLVAVHLASQALLEYDADQAIAGGVSVVLPHTPGWRFEPQGIHSADGVCRPFDAEANGTVMGDGAGLVVLRRLEDALADGCRIYAVLRGSAVNNDGSRKIGYAAPSVSGQAEVIRAAQVRAGIDPGDVGYVETHGTGTPLGDRVEFQALAEAFGRVRPDRARCALGSAKGAIGHLDVAAGVTGLIRAALALHHETLPGTVNHHTTHPDLHVEDSPFFVPATPMPWRRTGPRLAGVSSFGVGGTNVHAVLEQAPPEPRAAARKRKTLSDTGYRPVRHWPAAAGRRDVPPAGDAPSAAGAPDTHAQAPAPVAYHRATWREWTPRDHPPQRVAYARVVLLADAGPVGDRLGALLGSAGHDVERIPTPTDRPAAATGAAAGGRTLVVGAWSLAPDGHDRRGYDALTTIAAGRLPDGRPRGALDVVLLTSGVYPVTGDEEGDAALAALTGLARTISMDIPDLRVRVLDLPGTDAEVLADAAGEALAWHDEPLLARRGRRWWRLDYEPVAVPAEPPDAGRRTGPGAAVVLGVGQVGAAAARTLATAGGAVVLAARPGAGLHLANALAQELRSTGATVLVEGCDAGDAGQLEALLTRVADRFGAVEQVVLAAGISGEAAYQTSTELPQWRHERHFLVKVDGVAALGAAASRHGVRRVVLMSSVAGVLGAISLGPYSAAAAAMDCAAARFDGPETAWLSVAWDAWQHDDQAASAHERRMVQDGLTPTEADRALSDLLLSGTAGHLLVVKGDFGSRWDRFVRQPLRRTATATTRSADPAPDADLPQLVLDSWRSCLAEPGLGLDDDLLRHGADSLSSIEVLTGLGTRLGAALPTDLIFQAQTPRLFAEHVAQVLARADPGTDRPGVRRWHATGPLVWCLPPIGGDVDCFGGLAEILDGYRIRAAAGRSLADVDVLDSIVTQAGRYHGMLAEADEPPGVLVGWSYGGILAFEMAQRVFRDTGQRPAVVVLDIPAPAPPRRGIAEVDDVEIILAIGSHRAREAGRLGTVDMAELRREPGGGDEMASVLDRLRADAVVPASFSAALATRLARGYRLRMAAVEQYRPVPYPGRLILLRASEPEFGDTGILDGVLDPPADDPSWGWGALAEGGCTERTVDGHHTTLLQPPAVAAVARAVQHAADAAAGV